MVVLRMLPGSLFRFPAHMGSRTRTPSIFVHLGQFQPILSFCPSSFSCVRSSSTTRPKPNPNEETKETTSSPSSSSPSSSSPWWSPWSSSLVTRVQPYVELARAEKPIGTYLCLLPALWGLHSGAAMETSSDVIQALQYTLLFSLGAFAMRGAGCTINDMWDRDFDRRVDRTKNRPIASGRIPLFPHAWLFLAAQLGVGAAVLFSLNTYSILVGLPAVGLIATYPLAKRWMPIPQIYLGLTFNWGIFIGYATLAGALDYSVALPLYIAAIQWTVIYDTIYAHQDKIDDARIGIHSAALTLGERTKPWLFALSGGCLGSLAIAGLMADFAWTYYLAVTCSGWLQLSGIYRVDLDDVRSCWNEFSRAKFFGLIILIGIISGNMLS